MKTHYSAWKTSAEALDKPERLVAQVMNIGDYGDVCLLVHELREQGFKKVLQQSEAGEFDERSWHYRLGLAACEEDIPAMPSRMLPS